MDISSHSLRPPGHPLAQTLVRPTGIPEEPTTINVDRPDLRLSWLLAAVVVAAWWPLGTYWQSDDWLAVHYASDLGRALGDFIHNQYDLQGLVWLYRPLITLSFAVDYMIAGVDPFVSHLSNAIAHGLSAMLVGGLAQRFTGRRGAGFGAGLLWGLAPLHAGSVLWAVGRVDSHTTFWILLSTWLAVRSVDRNCSRVPALLAAVAALCSKETAIVLPGIVAITTFAAAGPGQRFRAAVRATWPFALLLAAYFAVRLLVLGRLVGGYEQVSVDPLQLTTALGTWTARNLNPLMVSDEKIRELLYLPRIEAWLLPWIGFLPAMATLLWCVVHRRWRLIAGALLAYVVCCVPTWQFWTATDHLQNWRYFTLPYAALAIAMGSSGIWITLLGLLVLAAPHLQIREDYRRVFDSSRQMHEQLREATAQLPAGPVLVAGLPTQNQKGNVVAFHLGVDRLLQPPFGPGRHRTLALRPLDPRPGVHRIDHGERFGVPGAQTLAFAGSEILSLLPPASPPSLGVVLDGPDHLTSELFADWHAGRATAWLAVRGLRVEHLRITLFTAGGYLSSILAVGDDGRVTMADWLQSRYAAEPNQLFVLQALRAATTMDLETRFPVLVEAGRVVPTPTGKGFETTHARRELLWLTFDRDYAQWATPAAAAGK